MLHDKGSTLKIESSFPGGLVVKNPSASAGDTGSILGLERYPAVADGNPLPIFLSGESHRQRILVSYSPWDHKQSDTTEAT